MELNRQIVIFNKITPVAIRLPAARIKFTVLDLLPYRNNLLRNRCNILRGDQDLHFSVLLLPVRFDEIEFRGDDLPVLLLIAIYQDLIEDRLSPIITPIRIPLTGRRQLFPRAVNIPRFIVYDRNLLAQEFQLVQLSFQGHTTDDDIPDIALNGY